uniref:Uncharacterized protein n=1 Tax=Bionectria ochroleuca TaxID=29856 RepID=A0A0B7KT74_BIOOC
MRDNKRRTPLSWATQSGSGAVVKLLLAVDKVDVDVRDNKGRTPLSWAALYRREAVVKLLLATDKVDIDVRDKEGRTPLSWAAQSGSEAANSHGLPVLGFSYLDVAVASYA